MRRCNTQWCVLVVLVSFMPRRRGDRGIWVHYNLLGLHALLRRPPGKREIGATRRRVDTSIATASHLSPLFDSPPFAARGRNSQTLSLQLHSPRVRVAQGWHSLLTRHGSNRHKRTTIMQMHSAVAGLVAAASLALLATPGSAQTVRPPRRRQPQPATAADASPRPADGTAQRRDIFQFHDPGVEVFPNKTSLHRVFQSRPSRCRLNGRAFHMQMGCHYNSARANDCA
jgi:hypothetical protein